MPVKLNDPAGTVDIRSDHYDAMLSHLQANILWAHGRDFARHVFLRFTGSRDAVRSWIRDIVAPSTTSAKEQWRQIEEHRAGGGADGGPVRGFFLASKGYQFLGFDTDRFASDAFRKGMKDRNEGLGGIITTILDTNNKDPDSSTWEGGFQKEVHALLTVADDDKDNVDAAVAAIRAGVAGIAEVLTVENGTVLRRTNKAGFREPVEHFGYFDGISNPLFTLQDLLDERPENRARTSWDPSARLSLVLTDDPFAEDVDAFGSYLVYRKLGQNVRAFDDRVVALATSLGVDPELAGALVVGRFKDGTPVALAKEPTSGPEVQNDFAFTDDQDGLRCPFQSHVRKVNPRGTTPLTSLESERRRRIVRRGIPYGKPVPGVDESLPSDPDPGAERGLLFMCFQQNIEEQFEFIQRTWVDNEHFPTGVLTLGLLQHDTGDDPVIGQDRNEGQRWPLEWNDKDGGTKAFNFESAVTLKGGEYFFAPSLPFLRAL